ncbi:MAG TPA: TlpA disulfide reductase family protein [Polyangiaceae bacterium]
MHRSLWGLAGLALAALSLVACGPVGQGAQTTAKNQVAPPDFELSTVDGHSERLSEHLGKEVVLLDFWATFCEPCLAGMPHLDALYRQHKSEGFVVLGIDIDGPDSIAQVKTTVSKLGVSFPILLDQETRVVALYNPKTSAPYSVLIGRDGRILKKQEGYTTGDAAAVERDVVAALARTPAPTQ